MKIKIILGIALVAMWANVDAQELIRRRFMRRRYAVELLEP